MKHGFTLVELLIVIAILAVLAAILFPVFGTVQASAKNATCLNNLSQIGKAMVLYSVDSQDALPWGPSEAAVYINPHSNEPFYALPTPHQLLSPYGTTHSLFRCPRDIKYSGVDLRGNFIIDGSSSFFSRMGSSYRYDLSGPVSVKLLSGVSRPSETLLAADLFYLHGSDVSQIFNVVYRDLHVKATLWDQLEVISRPLD